MGPGILYLSNTNNSYSGNTSLTGGTLSVAAAGCLGTSGSLAISNATLDFSGSGTFSRGISLSGSGANTIQADAGVMTLSGTLSGTGGLTKAGNGTLALGNSGNSYSGGTNVLAGTLQLQAAKALSSSSAVAVAGGAALDLNGLSPALANLSGGGAVTNKSSTTSTLNAAYVAGAASFAAIIQDGAGKVAVNVPSGGLLTLSNTANTYSGGTTVSGSAALSGGTLSVSADGNLGNGGSLALNNGVLQATAGFTLNSSRTLTLSGTSGVNVPAGQQLAFAGPLGGAGCLTKTNNGTLLLAGPAGAFSGNVSILAGNLAIANDASLSNTSGAVTINGGALEFTTATTSALALNLAAAASYVQVDAGVVTHSGLISGPGGLVKTGTGALSVTNAYNSYSGQTSISAGTLLDNDSSGLALGSGTTAVLIQAGAQLAGTGTVSQPVTCNAGAVSPGYGTAIGTLSLQAGLNLNNGSSVTFKLSNRTAGYPITGVSDCINFEPYTDQWSGYTTWNSGLQTTGTCTAYLTGTPVPSTTFPYVLFSNWENQGNNSPSLPGNFNVIPPPGYSVTLSVKNAGQDYNTSVNAYEVLASLSFQGPEWTSSGGTGAWANSNNWNYGAPNSAPSEDKTSRAGGGIMLGTNGSGTIDLTPNDPNYVNVLVLNNSNSSYVIAAPSSGTLASGTLSLTPVSLQGVNTGNASVQVVTGTHSITAAVSLVGATDVTIFDPAAVLTIGGAVSGTGSLALAGSGSLVLSSSGNSFSGGATISGGTLQLAAAGALPRATALTLSNSTGALVSLNGYSQTIASLSGGGANGGNVALGSGVLTVGDTSSTTYGGVASGAGGLIKVGAGTLTLGGTNAYTGATTVNGGTLVLTGALSSGSLVGGGGAFTYANPAGNATQTFSGGLTLNPGASALNNSVSGDTLALGAIQRNLGGTVDFTTTSGAVTTSAGNTNGILGGWATVAGTNWAVNSTNGANGPVAAFAAYTASTTGSTAPGSTANVDFQASNGTAWSTQSVNSLRFNTAAATTLAIAAANRLTDASGGILVTANVGNNSTSITGGTLQGASGQDLVVIQNNASGGLTIGSVIADNQSATALTKAGPGTLVLTGSNTYSGGTTISGGVLFVNGAHTAPAPIASAGP